MNQDTKSSAESLELQRIALRNQKKALDLCGSMHRRIESQRQKLRSMLKELDTLDRQCSELLHAPATVSDGTDYTVEGIQVPSFDHETGTWSDGWPLKAGDAR